MTQPEWWEPTSSYEDAESSGNGSSGWHITSDPARKAGQILLDPLDDELDQIRSKDRVRDLAEVFTHRREVDAILDLVNDAFGALDIKFLEPAAGSGNFTVEILRRKLELVDADKCDSQESYEHLLLRATASIYGIDISLENVTEARSRMAHALLEHYHADANTVEPTPAFLNAAGCVLGANIVRGDTLEEASEIELCDWQPASGGRFRRVWSYALVPPADRDLFWAERIEDTQPIHYSELAPFGEVTGVSMEATP